MAAPAWERVASAKKQSGGPCVFLFPFCRRFRGGKCPTVFRSIYESFLPILLATDRAFWIFRFKKTVVVSSARALRERAPVTRMMTNPADATQVDIAEKENAPSPAVKASPKPAANGDGSSKFVNVDGKVKHRRVVKADGVDAVTHADAAVGAEQEPANDYERQREVRDSADTRAIRHATPARSVRPAQIDAHPVHDPSTLHPGTHPSQQRAARRSKCSTPRRSRVPRTPPRTPPPPRTSSSDRPVPRRQTRAAAAPRAKSRRLAAVASATPRSPRSSRPPRTTAGSRTTTTTTTRRPRTSRARSGAKRGIVPGPGPDGRFRGWVAPGLVESLGLAASAAEAWESNGGGSFAKAGKARAKTPVCP